MGIPPPIRLPLQATAISALCGSLRPSLSTVEGVSLEANRHCNRLKRYLIFPLINPLRQRTSTSTSMPIPPTFMQRDAADVEIVRLLRLSVQDEPGRLRGVERDARDGGEVVARPRRDQPYAADGGVGEPVEHFVQRSVSPHDDDLRGGVFPP